MHFTMCLVMAVVIPSLVQGTSECYQCLYVDIDQVTSPLGIMSENACKNGDKLDDFVINCKEEAWINDPNIFKTAHAHAHKTSQAEEKSYACGRISLKGKVANTNFEFVTRTCLSSSTQEAWEGFCFASTVEKILSGENPEFLSGSDLEFIKGAWAKHGATGDFETCMCTEEKCNNAKQEGSLVSF